MVSSVDVASQFMRLYVFVSARDAYRAHFRRRKRWFSVPTDISSAGHA